MKSEIDKMVAMLTTDINALISDINYAEYIGQITTSHLGMASRAAIKLKRKLQTINNNIQIARTAGQSAERVFSE